MNGFSISRDSPRGYHNQFVKECIIWMQNKAKGMATARLAYNFIARGNSEFSLCWQFKQLWLWNIPLKIKCFNWLCGGI